MASSVHTELINVSFCWLVNISVSKCRRPYEDINYEFILTSSVMSSMSWIDYEMVSKWPNNSCFVRYYYQGLIRTACSVLVQFTYFAYNLYRYISSYIFGVPIE